VLPFDAVAARRYTHGAATRARSDRPISGFDAQIAAICLAVGARLATSNVHDFDGLGVEVIDPWDRDQV